MIEAQEPRDENEQIHVAIAFDHHYLHQFYALAASLVDHHKKGDLCIHAITSGVEDKVLEQIREFFESCGQVKYYSIEQDTVLQFVVSNQWTTAVYYRLFIPLLVPPAVKRLLYLDSDTVVIRHLKELYGLDLKGRPVGAVVDNYVKTQPLIGIHQEGHYFNSGVLLIDIAQWKQHEVSEQAKNYLLQHPERLKYVDQCALNAVLKNNWEKLEIRFNVLYSHIPDPIGRESLKLFLEDKVIIHFTVQRPWNMLCKNRLRSLYHYYSRLYPYGQKPNKYTDFAWSKIPAWLKIRMLEFYFDYPVVQKWWRGRKASVS